MKSAKLLTPACLAFVLALLVFSLHAQEKKRLTFEQIFKNAEPKLTKELPNIIGWADDDHYLEMKKKGGDQKAKVYAIDVISGKEKVHRDLEQYAALVDTGISVANPASNNEAYTRLIYVKDKDIHFLDTEKKSFKRLTQTSAEEKNPTLSPDSKHLAFFRFDDAKVPVLPLYDAQGVHGLLENAHYPKPGDPNPQVRVGVVPVTGGSVVWADFNEKDDQYFGTPFWTPDGKQLVAQWMNRGQDNLKLYAVDPATGKKAEIYNETQSSWVDWFESIEFLAGDKGFIIKSDKNGSVMTYANKYKGLLRGEGVSGEFV